MVVIRVVALVFSVFLCNVFPGKLILTEVLDQKLQNLFESYFNF